MTKVIKQIECDLHVIRTLEPALKDKRNDDPRDGYWRVEGFHPRCGGYCTLVDELDEDGEHRYSIKKPHDKCDPIGCLDSKCLCTGIARPLPEALLDCMSYA